jgi:hypothetical protein
MQKINFTFLRNRLFLAGLLSGALITALAFILIISSNYQSPEKNKLKGTMSAPYTPSIGDEGTALAWGLECSNSIGYSDVIFDKDPGHNTKHCHYQGSAKRVKIVSIADGPFCSGGGITVNAIIDPN